MITWQAEERLSVNDLPPESVIFGSSAAMLDVQSKIQRIPGTNLPILIQGESGTGKDLLSRFIHCCSGNTTGPYVRINCATDSALFESALSTLFPPESASDVLPPPLNLGSIATLFLDEVAELPPESQMRFLHAMPENWNRKAYPGARARIVAATTHNLREEVRENRFRRELFYRLAVVTLDVPPLRERLPDLLTMADYFRVRYSDIFSVPEKPFSERVIKRMQYYEWPGNIRELENFVCRCVILGVENRLLGELDADQKSVSAVLLAPGDAQLKEVTKRTLARVERELLLKALDLHQGSLQKASRALGISRETLLKKMDPGRSAARAPSQRRVKS